jgi:repressor LexA
MTLGQIIKSYRKANNMSMKDFATASGLSKAYIGILESGVNPRTKKPVIPSTPTIKKVAKAIYMDFYELFSKLDDDVVLGDDDKTVAAIPIPILGKVAAGIPIETIENIIGYEEISEKLAKTGDFFALRVKGDSMEPRICEGDVLIVRKQENAVSGDIVIAMVNDDDATCKRYVKYSDEIRLIAFNKKYEKMIFTNEDLKKNPVKIIGKVVENRQKWL